MRATLDLARREVAYYLGTWTGYVIIALVLLIDGILFNALAVPGDKLSARVIYDFFYFTSGVTMIACPIISMRLIAEERESGTIALLYSSPIRDWEIVLGKFLGALAFLVVLTLPTVYMPALVLLHGKVSLGHLAAGYFGLALLGSASLAIGTFGSSLVRIPILAGVVSGVMMGAMLLLWKLAQVCERPLREVLNGMSLHGLHFAPFQSGVVHLRDVVYYLAVTYVALFGATRVLESRRWR